jgi:hypothetical protein
MYVLGEEGSQNGEEPCHHHSQNSSTYVILLLLLFGRRGLIIITHHRGFALTQKRCYWWSGLAMDSRQLGCCA